MLSALPRSSVSSDWASERAGSRANSASNLVTKEALGVVDAATGVALLAVLLGASWGARTRRVGTLDRNLLVEA